MHSDNAVHLHQQATTYANSGVVATPPGIHLGQKVLKVLLQFSQRNGTVHERRQC